MSGQTNTREYRQQVIVELLEQLHQGKSPEEVKARFAEVFASVSAAEISEAEQALIAGGLPVEEVLKLCDIHAAVFKGSIDEIHAEALGPTETPGHPAHTLMQENRLLEHLMDGAIADHLAGLTAAGAAGDAGAATDAADELAADLAELRSVDIHYSRKENVFFPFLEKHGIDAPPKVMWAKDDDIRSLIKTALAKAEDFDGSAESLAGAVTFACDQVREMIFKEEHILLPMMLEHFTEHEWEIAAAESSSIGYALIATPPAWPAAAPAAADTAALAEVAGTVTLPSGRFTVDQLTAVLNALPVDITFVDANDQVAFFSENEHRIFARTRAIVGREVINCHPPQSMHVVQSILDDFRAGTKSSEEFWIQMRGMFIYIRYFAVRGSDGEYLGTLEVSQEISGIKELTGEKRLMEE